MQSVNLTNIFKNGGLLIEATHIKENIEFSTRPHENAHIHNCCEIYFNISGDVSFAVEDKVYSINSGDIIITKDNEIHYCIYNQNCLYECYCLWIFADEPYIEYLSPFYKRSKGINNRISLNEEQKNQMQIWLNTIISENKNMNNESIQNVTAVLNVINLINSCKDNTVSPNEFTPLLCDILNYINAHYKSECTIKNICDEFYISRSSLNRLFISNLNTTPSAYIESKRFSKAKTMLKSGKSVQETFEQCGFSDYSHFIARFKKKFGVTPYKFSKKSMYD